MSRPVNENWLKYKNFEDITSSFITSSKKSLKDYLTEIQEIYLADQRPWVIGFSGGKDSTAVLQLIYLALLQLNEDKRQKPIFVVSSDTLVETPMVVNIIHETLEKVENAAKHDKLPISCHLVYPKTNSTFWVNLLGRGYPAPTKQFRWCTERMKINPVSDFIVDKVSKYDEVIVVLGSRKQESSSRAQVIEKHKRKGSRLAVHTTLAHAYIYTPIEDWSVHDVWDFLNGVEDFKSPWDGSNYPLWDLYQGSSAGECPLVIDASTPSCGNSRFGCWVCTVVTRDRAMEGLIESGEDWMKPLLDFRNELSKSTKPENKNTYRHHMRRTGKVSYKKTDEGEINYEKHIPGPYLQKYRKQWLEELLELQKQLNKDGHQIELITKPELHEIRNEWIKDPNEPDWADSLPLIYRKVYGEELDWIENDAGAFTKPDADLLEELQSEYGVSAEMVMKLLELELSMDGLGRRSRIFDKIESILSQDWGTLDQITEKHKEFSDHTNYDKRLKQLNDEYEAIGS